MQTENEQTPVDNPAAAVADASPQPSQKSEPPADETDNLLSEFDSPAPAPRGKPSNEPAPMSFEDRIRQGASDFERRLAEKLQPNRDQQTVERNDRLEQLEQFANQIVMERAAEQERAETEIVFNQGREHVQDIAPWLPGDYAQNWLRNEAMTDGDLAHAWDNRHASPESAAVAQNQVKRAMKRFVKHLKSLPDPKASDDRALVSAAVKGASGAPPPPAKTDYNSLSDADFSNELAKKYGFRPGF